MSHRKKIIEEKLTWSDKLAQKISESVGNIWFVWIQAIIFVIWISTNVMLGENGWDPYPFIFLVLIVSLEAIFLSTFVLIAQNRESKKNEIRDILDYEVDTKAAANIVEIKSLIQKIVEKNNEKL